MIAYRSEIFTGQYYQQNTEDRSGIIAKKADKRFIRLVIIHPKERTNSSQETSVYYQK
jgi:hypothetical protein